MPVETRGQCEVSSSVSLHHHHHHHQSLTKHGVHCWGYTDWPVNTKALSACLCLNMGATRLISLCDSYTFSVDLNSSPHAWVASTSLSQLVTPWSFHPYRVEFFSLTLFFSYRLWAYALHGPGAACQVPKCHMPLFSTSGVRTVHSIWKVDYPGNPSSTAIQVPYPGFPREGLGPPLVFWIM